MKQGLFRKLLPHLVAIVVFLVIALIYCKPALEGKVLQQSDITGWKGAVHQSEEYAKLHDGKSPLWTNALFSGMPAFQIGVNDNNFIPKYVHKLLTLGTPEPIQFFFLACICFYFLCLVLRINPYIGIMGSLAFAYATYNPVIISVGHNTKMWCIAYMPALLGSMMLIYEKKYWMGAALTALFTSVMISMNHLQIFYYIFITIAIMTIFYLIRWIRNKEFKHLAFSAAFGLAGVLVGIFTNSTTLMSTYEYQKETIRGGPSVLKDTASKVDHSLTGLEKDYAFSYSMTIGEPLVMMFPRMYGGSSDKEEVSADDSKAIEALRALPEQLQQQLPTSFYWGGMTRPGEVGVSGPPYAGAIICFLAILAMFALDGKHKWWAFTAIVLSIMMSWGAYFDGFNTLFYEYLPFFNKFRAPSMIVVICQLLLPMLAVLAVDKIVNTADKKTLFPAFKKGLIATGGIFILALLVYASSDFLSGNDKEILKQVRGAVDQPQLYQAVNSFYDGMKADRKSLMLGDIFRSLGYVVVAGLALFALIRLQKGKWALIAGLTLVVFIDLITVDTKYLNSDNYLEDVDNSYVFQKTKPDEQLLADTSFYRVINVSGNPFTENITSYHYNSIGGYHAAKLRLYQDVIEHQLAKNNMNVLNMLNTKYFIQRDRQGLTQNFQQNPDALGNAWFVKTVNFVKGPDEEMAAISNFNPRDTAFVQESFKASVPFMPQYDSAASIRLVKNDNDIITYSSQSSTNQFAVFSEVYYAAGWKAFVDGKETPIVKVNYVLRGLALQAGNHNIEFRFEPQGYIRGHKLTSIFCIILLLMLAGGIFMEWKKSKSSTAPRTA
jgi:hypothetical protein